MFEVLGDIAKVGAMIGLSGGALIGCAALAYFVSAARPLALAAMLAIGGTLGGFLYGHHDGERAIKAEWAAANEKAKADAEKRDADTKRSIAAQYEPVITALNKQNTDLQSKVTAYENRINAQKGAASCSLGAPALRLRHR